MALIQPFTITWNNENLSPDSSNYRAYRQSTDEVIFVNHKGAYGETGIPKPYNLLIVLNGGLYRENAPLDDYIVIEDIVAGTTLDDIYAMVSADITKPGFIFDGIYQDSEFTDEVTPTDRLEENQTIFIKWIED